MVVKSRRASKHEKPNRKGRYYIRLRKHKVTKEQRNRQVKINMALLRANESLEKKSQRLARRREAYKRKRLTSVDPTGGKRKVTANSEASVDPHTLNQASIDEATSEALNYLHRTHINDTDVHKAHVCLICDMFILGTEPLLYISKKSVQRNRKRLSVEQYKSYYNIPPCSYTDDPLRDLWEYYHVAGFPGMLLSKRSRYDSEKKGYSCCKGCFYAMTPNKADSKPPKFSIANGFAIGTVPTLKYTDENGKQQKFNVEDDVTDVMRALLAPVRTHGYVMAFTGGSHKSIQGHYQFFEMDHNRLGGALHHITHTDKKQHVYCMMSGRFTPSQKRRITQECKVDTNIYIRLSEWFITESGHPGFRGVTIPKDCPQPVIIQDEETQNNTDHSLDPDKENKFDGGSYFFSSGQDPRPNTSVYKTNQQFTMAMVNNANPRLLVYGGNYASRDEILVENLLPFAFPYGRGGPKQPRPVKVSLEVCLQRYMRLAMRQFMRGDVILVLHHMYARQLSYKSGVMTCRANICGETLGEKFSKIPVEEFQNAVESNSGKPSDQLTKRLFKSISTSCRAMGHTPEAAQFARRCCFSMQDYFGLNSVFITITPCDECSFRVRLLVQVDDIARNEHPANSFLNFKNGECKLPPLDSSDEECTLDFVLRQKLRLKYPGACSLEYQSLMNILVESLFQWDIQKKSPKGVGIFGKTVAFAPADEEQGRKTLHQHVQLWVEDFDTSFRKRLFDNDARVRKVSREHFFQYIDKIMSASFGPDLLAPVTKRPKEKMRACEILADVNPQIFRDARHEELNKTVRGRVMKDLQDGSLISTEHLINHSLKTWRRYAMADAFTKYCPDTTLPLTQERADIAAYTYSYHMEGGSNETNQVFWSDKSIRQLILTARFDLHEHSHRASCFKKGCECRFLFPFLTCQGTYIHEDPGQDNENEVVWHSLLENPKTIAPWMVIPHRPMGCHYVNVHNKALSAVFNCNTNVQVGDPFHMYYITLYNLKSTQEDDSERQRRIGETIIKRLVRIQDETRLGLRDESNTDCDFTEGLCRMLGGMNAATSRYTVSSTMAHLLICQAGTRFKFSHNFSDLLVGQLEATLEGNLVDYRVRVNRHRKKRILWRDSLAEDYIHRPDIVLFEKMCSYEMASKYKKKFLSFKQMDKLHSKDENDDGDENNLDDYVQTLKDTFTGVGFPFSESHPGFHFSHLAELEHMVIPKISLPEGKLCSVEDLHMGETDTDEQVSKCREDYAKMALLMFHPFRRLQDLLLEGSYWKRFSQAIDCYKAGGSSDFWSKGFEILQNIQDRLTLQKKLHRSRDPITLQTLCQSNTKKKVTKEQVQNEDEFPDISKFMTVYEDEYDLTDLRHDEERGHNEILSRTPFYDHHFIHARMLTTDSILKTSEDRGYFADSNRSQETSSSHSGVRSYPMMLQLVFEALPNYGSTLIDDNVENDDLRSQPRIPSMSDIVNKVAKEEGKILDKKQLIAYESICATFLLALINDGHDVSTPLGKYFCDAMKHDTDNNCNSTESDTHQQPNSYNCDDFSENADNNSSVTDLLSSGFSDCSESSDFEEQPESQNHFSDNSSISTESDSDSVSEASLMSNHSWIDQSDESIKTDLKKIELHLRALGGKNQLLMFLTGPAGAGKTTAVKVAEQFCFEFCKAVSLAWSDNRFLFTAYTGSAASCFGGRTICKAAYLNKKHALDDCDILHWQGVRLLVIDEISFMKSSEMRKLDENLQVLGQNTKPFGGFSIIFSGDFRQLEPPGAKESELLFSRSASVHWEEKLNSVLILENKHRFKNDKRYGKLLKRMWVGDLTTRDRKWLNERVIHGNKNLNLPKADEFGEADVVYAAPTNKERNSISAGNFKDHILKTHPNIDSLHEPPSHTIIIEADIRSAAPKRSKQYQKKIGGTLRHRIITTCGDANVTAGTKKIDPALCLYMGAHLICTIGNENLDKKVPRGNGTLCRMVGLKLKEDQTTYRWKNYYGKKVWTVCASDVDWIECEHYPKPKAILDLEHKISVEKLRKSEPSNDETISSLLDSLDRERSNHRFKLKPRQDRVTVNVKVHPLAQSTEPCICKMTQIPVNTNDATTGHKLQGMSKDVVIITSWPKGGLFKNWEYVVLSRVRTHSGLYLFSPISMEKSFEPSEELSAFFKRARKKEQSFIAERKNLRCTIYERNYQSLA